MSYNFDQWSQSGQNANYGQHQSLEQDFSGYVDEQQRAQPSYNNPFQFGSSTYQNGYSQQSMPTNSSSNATYLDNHAASPEPYQPQDKAFTFSAAPNPRQQQAYHQPTSSFSQSLPIPGSSPHFSPPIDTHTRSGTVPQPQQFGNHFQNSNPIPNPSQKASKHRPAASGSKRARPDLDDLDEDDEGDGTDIKDKSNKPGACSRCKNLKVRCEFKTDTDPCKRCFNGGHECFIPGRKKRRTPPKREHLLKQITEQAEQIQKLMLRLEEVNNSSHAPHSSASDSFNFPGQDSISPLVSPSTGDSPNLETVSAPVQDATSKDVENWLAKAKDSLAEFGGFIGAVPKSYIVSEDPEDSPTPSDVEDDDYSSDYNTAGEFDFSIIDSDGNDSEEREVQKKRKTLRNQRSTSSFGGEGSRKKDATGKDSKLATIPSEAVPFGLMAELALKKSKRTRSSSGDVDPETGKPAVGVASDDFFRRSPGPDPRATAANNALQAPPLPVILTRHVVTIQEAEKLFTIFFENMNLSVSLVDPVLYTAQKTCFRSPFLFTVICAIASRYYVQKPELYLQAMHYAQLAAGTALISGPKNIELCIAYILLSLYPVPAKRWEDERGWIYLGLAIRFAVDLNLHLPNTAQPTSEMHAREMLNRTRVWLNCFNLDRSTGSQFGKAPVINNLDYVANHSGTWWNNSPYNMEHFDIHLCCYNAELRVMSRFISKIYSNPNHPTGLNKDVDFERVSVETDEELQQLAKIWFERLDETDMTVPQNCFRTGLLKLAFSYARLVALSFGFQHAFGKNDPDQENPFLLRCLAAAKDVVHTVVNDIGRPSQRIYVRHGPEAQSVFVTFASAFLVKLLQPKFEKYLTHDKRVEIRELVKSAINLLGCAEVAIDDRHGPKLYSKFLKGLLNAPMAKVDPPRANARKTGRTKSSSSTDQTVQSMSHNPSPAMTSSTLSPLPSSSALSFEQFAPVGGIIDPFAQIQTSPAHIMQGMNNALDLNMDNSHFFNPPLPFDDELLHQMQSITSQTEWQDMPSLPGFNWMRQFQGGVQHFNNNMPPPDFTMYPPPTNNYQ